MGIMAGGNGATLWDCALGLASHLQQQKGWKGKRCLELGAGIGLIALVLASLGAHVIATERDLALPLLQRNVNDNNAGGCLDVRVESLDWSLADNLKMPQCDFFVGADLVFPSNSEVHDGLAKIMALLVKGGAEGLYAHESRKPATDVHFLELLATHGVTARRLPPSELPGDWPRDLHLLNLSAHNQK